MKSGHTLLRECVESGKLDDKTFEAFAEMLANLDDKRFQKLTKRQYEWVANIHERLGLDPGVENLVTTGAVKVTDEERVGLRTWAASLGPKVLRPPGLV
jgi:hypothetical protein